MHHHLFIEVALCLCCTFMRYIASYCWNLKNFPAPRVFGDPLGGEPIIEPLIRLRRRALYKFVLID